MKRLRFVFSFGLLLVLGCASEAAEFYWTNKTGGAQYFTNSASAWSLPGVPGASDNVYFTNTGGASVAIDQSVANANANFNAFTATGVVTQRLSSGVTWTLTNSYVIGGTLNSTSAVRQELTGLLAVTNNGQAVMIVGDQGRGTFTLANASPAGGAPNLIADQLIVGRTNGGVGAAGFFNQTTAGSVVSILGDMIVGQRGRGTYTLSAAATNSVGGQMVIGQYAGATGAVSQSSGVLLLTNAMVIGQNAGATGTVSQTGGLLVVTNASGTGSLVVGQSGRGSFTLGSGTATLIVDQLIATNNQSGVFTNSVLGLNAAAGATLTTRSSIIKPLLASYYNIGGGGFTWNMVGGTNLIDCPVPTYIGAANANNTINISGNGTVWTNVNAVRVGNTLGSSSNQVKVTAGARVYVGGITYCGGDSSLTNTMVVSGSNSLWSAAGGILIGNNAVAQNNLLLVSNGGTVISSGPLTVGYSGNLNQLLVLNTGLVVNTGNLTIGNKVSSVVGLSNSVLIAGGSTWTNTGAVTVGSFSSNNTMTVTDPGSTLYASNTFYVGGSGGAFNQLIVSNGATVCAGGSSSGMAVGSGSPGNTAVVTGSNSVLTVFNTLTVGSGAGVGLSNQFLVLDGGKVTFPSWINIGGGTTGTGAHSNTVVVAGNGSSLIGDVSSVYVGAAAAGNRLIVTNGGLFSSLGVFAGNTGATNSLVLVSDPGTILSNTVVTVGVGTSLQNQFILSNGAQAFISQLIVGSTNVGLGNQALITSGALLEANTLQAGQPDSPVVSGSISNLGGIFQFTTATPTIAPNQTGMIALDKGTISFRGVASAAVLGGITNIAYSGANTLRLDSSTNAAVAYALTNGGPFRALTLVNGNPMWQGSTLLVGEGTSLLVTNAFATLAAVLTNSGTITVANGTINYLSNVVLNSGSSYLSQSGTNTFANVLIASGASFLVDALSQVTILGNYQNQGASVFSNQLAVSGDYVGTGASNRFVGGLLINPSGSFHLSNATATVDGTTTNFGNMTVMNSVVTYGAPVVLSGGYVSDPSTNVFTTNVTVAASGWLQGGTGDLFRFERSLAIQSTNLTLFDLTAASVLFTNGAGAHLLDLAGSLAFDNGTNYAGIASVLTNFAIGSLTLSAGDGLHLTGGASNALYVGALDFGGLAYTNSLALDVNLYYDATLAANAYLGGNSYNFGGAGWLTPYGTTLPIPEPGAGALVVAALLVGVLARNRKRSA